MSQDEKSPKPLFKWMVLIMAVLLLTFVPLFFKPGAEFSGTDDKAKNAIREIQKDYTPWFKPLWQPPSKEIEGLLFTFQACLGTAILFFYLGFLFGKKNRK